MKKLFCLFLTMSVQSNAGVSFQDLLKPASHNWLSYSGDLTAQRYSLLKEINPANVNRLIASWIFHVPDSKRLQTTPIVVDGVMYVTDSNQVFALDARTGRAIWHFRRTQAKQTLGNRGVAVLEDRVFFLSSDCHVIALHAKTGALLWDVEYASSDDNYSATLAPLAIPNKVIVGVGGGDCGMRGFVAAFDTSTGKELWRFWTIPARGEPGSETWGGHPVEISGGATWMTGAYDASQDLVIWTTGNPGPDFFGERRSGDNLYTDCVVALEAKTGRLKWFFQFTPHDTHDWDAQEFPVLIDTRFRGEPRKLLVQANRNGFFYVLDRTNGQMLLAKPFVKKLNWARGILASGRPDLVQGMDPSPEGRRVCPGVIGGTNWFSPSYNPETELFYVMSVEQCDIYTSSSRSYKKGECYSATGVEPIASEPGRFVLRALDIHTGNMRWEIPLTGNGTASSAMPGTLATAGGLVFFADDAGYIAAADGRSGETLWHFYTGQMISASPMTYSVAGKQHVAIATATDVISFTLFDASAVTSHRSPVERIE